MGSSEIDGRRDSACVESILSTKCVVARTNLVHLIEDENVSNLNILEPRDRDKIALRDEIGATSDGCNCVVVGLRFEKRECLLARSKHVCVGWQDGRRCGGRCGRRC